MLKKDRLYNRRGIDSTMAQGLPSEEMPVGLDHLRSIGLQFDAVAPIVLARAAGSVASEASSALPGGAVRSTLLTSESSARYRCRFNAEK